VYYAHRLDDRFFTNRGLQRLIRNSACGVADKCREASTMPPLQLMQKRDAKNGGAPDDADPS
jgi:hypothetical protein